MFKNFFDISKNLYLFYIKVSYNYCMKIKKISIYSQLTIFGLIYILLDFFLTIHMMIQGELELHFQYLNLIYPIAHFTCFILGIIVLIKKNKHLFFLVFQIESIISLISDFALIGIFLFHASMFILYIDYYDSKKANKIMRLCFLIHVIVLCYNFIINWEKAVIYLLSTIFSYFVFTYIAELLKSKYSCFIPTTVTLQSKLSNIEPGKKIKLSELGLNERQCNFIYDYVINNLSYNDLTEKYFVSLSTVKKEFADSYKILGVNKLEELHILLLQYQIEK